MICHPAIAHLEHGCIGDMYGMESIIQSTSITSMDLKHGQQCRDGTRQMKHPMVAIIQLYQIHLL